jgi:hypothetical protein
MASTTRPDDQAFPTPPVYIESDNSYLAESGRYGLTIREEFAKAIYAAILSAPDSMRPADGAHEQTLRKTAREAVRCADYLIDALNEPRKEAHA